MDTEKKDNQRRHPVYKFPTPALENLIQLANKSPPENVSIFTKDYGRILTWLKSPLTEYQKDGLQALFQFYDRELRCFVFPDYLLMPTLEEYSHILDIPILQQVPFHASMEKPTDDQIAKALCIEKSIVSSNGASKGAVKGFHLGFLLREANAKASKKNWKGYNAILACCIYGMVLFPNEPKFIDMNAISIFIHRNPVPTLLGDVYHSIHARSFKGKGGFVHCCAPLLYHWFQCFLPRSGAFIDTQHTMTWVPRLMALTSQDIGWYRCNTSKTENEKIIIRCGDFPNVPLIGIRGGVNYNPTLALRQLGYALMGPPDEVFVRETLYYDVPDVTGSMTKAIQAWKSIRLEGGQYFGKKDPTAYASYIQWIKERNCDRQWPSITGAASFYPQELVPDMVSKGDYERVRAQNRLLLEEKETLSVNYLVATQEKNQLMHELKYFKGEASDATNKRSRVEDYPTPAAGLKKAVAEVKEKYKQKSRDFEVLKTLKDEMEKKYKAQIEELKKKMHNQKLAHEAQIKEKNVQLSLAIEELERFKIQMGIQDAEGYPMSDV